MRFPHAWRTEENHVAGFVDESQRTQFPNLALVDGRLEAEIKLLEVFHERQMRQLQLGTQVTSAPSFYLAAQQFVQKFGIARLFLGGLLQQVFQPCLQSFQPQTLQRRVQSLDRSIHRPPPFAALSYASRERFSTTGAL